MKLIILKPPKRGKLFVTLTAAGLCFFSTRAVADLGLSRNTGVLMAQDEDGGLYIKTWKASDANAFRVYVRKNGVCSVTYIQIAALIRRLGIEVKKSTRYYLVEAEDEFYKIEGLKMETKPLK